MKTLLNAIILPTCAAALVACGGGGGSPAAEISTVSLSGTASKGVLIGADVTAYAVGSTTPLATAKTDASGNYELKLSPTTGPVIVEVKANDKTEMLDETELDGASFKKVAAPKDLVMRSFAANVNQAVTVRINPYTEMAVAVAESAVSGGKKAGLSLQTLVAGQEVARLAAPEGVDPFTAAPVAKPNEMTETQLKFAVQMAGLLQQAKADTACQLQCQVAKLSEGVTVTMTASGTAEVPGAVALAIQEKKKAVVDAGANAMKVDSTVQATLVNVASALTAEADAAVIAAEAKKTETTTTRDPQTVAAENGLQGFIDAMRKGFRDTETRLTDVEQDLNKRYEKVSLDGLGLVGKVLDSVDADCDSQTLTCTTRESSLFKWQGTGNSYSWETKQPDSEGRTFKGTLVGSKAADGTMTATINGSISMSGGEAVKMTNLVVSMYDGGNEDFKATINGSLTANDSASTTTVTLKFNNLAVESKPRAASPNIADVSFKGDLSLESSLGDKLTGSVDVKIVEVTKTINTMYGNSYDDFDEYVISAAINLTADTTISAVKELASLNITGSSSLPDYTKPASESNVEKYRAAMTISLADKLTSISFTESADTWKNMKQVATIKSGTSEVMLTADYSTDVQNGSWCVWNEVQRCTNTLELTSTNTNPYKASLTKSSTGKTQGKIMLGETQVGEIVNGILKINGVEVSLY